MALIFLYAMSTRNCRQRQALHQFCRGSPCRRSRAQEGGSGTGCVHLHGSCTRAHSTLPATSAATDLAPAQVGDQVHVIHPVRALGCRAEQGGGWGGAVAVGLTPSVDRASCVAGNRRQDGVARVRGVRMTHTHVRAALLAWRAAPSASDRALRVSLPAPPAPPPPDRAAALYSWLAAHVHRARGGVPGQTVTRSRKSPASARTPCGTVGEAESVLVSNFSRAVAASVPLTSCQLRRLPGSRSSGGGDRPQLIAIT